MVDGLQRCFSEVRVRGLVLPNRLIKAATAEGMTSAGVPTPKLAAFHERIAQGGVGMTTVAYCAVDPDGRIDEDNLHLHEGARSQLESLTQRVKAAGARVSAQLVHAGGFTRNRKLEGRRPLGPSLGLNRLGALVGLGRVDAMTVAQIKQRVDAFARAASFAVDVGFDALEIHFGHGYGISQFISPKTNRRADDYGGTLRNRMRFALEVLEAVRNAAGDDVPLLGKISMTDGVAGGVTYEESVEIAAMLEAGGIDVIVCSGGTSSMNPMLLFRGDSILGGLLEHERSRTMRWMLRAAAPVMFKTYPYQETYFLEPAQRIRDRVQCGVCYIGGVSGGDSLERLMSAGFDFVQLGRVLLYDPDFPKSVRSDPEHRSGCSHCNRCAGTINAPGGIYCPERAG